MLLWLLAGAGLLLVLRSEDAMAGAQIIGDVGRRQLFLWSIPPAAQQYADLILQVADELGIDPFILVGIGDRESRWGLALDAAGKGDNGHGHGLMQIDDGSFGPWLAANDWRDPYTNIRKGGEVFVAARNALSSQIYLSRSAPGGYVELDEAAADKRGIGPGTYPDPRPLAGDALLEASIAAYNTGAVNVLRSIAAGLPADTTTAGGDYARDVLRRADEARSLFSTASSEPLV